jgi:RNA polymerase sigma factor (sigma-70 family)
MNSEAALPAAAVRPASPASFEEYVRLRSDGLVRLACLITRDWEEARDAVQDALVSVYPRWPALEEQGRDAYVRRAVTNACLTHLRRLRRVRPVGDPALLAQAPVVDDHGTAVAVANAAWALCADLPPVQRAAVVLRFHDDLSFAEVAHALGCPEATARSHIHRALKALRARCEAGEGDD